MNCEICGEEISGGSAFTCNYCGGVFCPEHRLPFNHNCKNIAEWKKAGAPGKKTTRYQKKAAVPGITVRRKKELIIGGAIVICLLVLIGIYLF